MKIKQNNSVKPSRQVRKSKNKISLENSLLFLVIVSRIFNLITETSFEEHLVPITDSCSIKCLKFKKDRSVSTLEELEPSSQKPQTQMPLHARPERGLVRTIRLQGLVRTMMSWGGHLHLQVNSVFFKCYMCPGWCGSVD